MPEACPPTLIVAFNRPAATEQLVRALRQVAPRRVYAAVDGPRAGVREDEVRCQQVRDLLTSLPWKPELRTLFRESNVGCGPAVAGAIDWFFQHEAEGVILEDDVLPHPSMFPFMSQMLARYRSDERILHVSASNYAGARATTSYFYSRYVSIWGWATWRRAWEHFSLDISGWRRPRRLLRQPGLDWRTRRYLAFSFDRAAAGLGNWDYQWKHAVLRNGLALTPSFNLAVTTGFGDEATHLHQRARVPPLEEMPGELTRPPVVVVNPQLDRQLYAEQLARGCWYQEASRLLVPEPRLHRALGQAARGLLSRWRS